MINLNKKILKLVKIAIKLVAKLIETIQKIETTYLQAKPKVAKLSGLKIELNEILNKLEGIQKKLEDNA